MKKAKFLNKRLLPWIVSLGVFAILMLVSIPGLLAGAASAAPSVSVTAIDYDAETITVKASKSDTKIFISNSSQTTWEAIENPIDSKTYEVVFDISWVSKTSDYILSIKGDYSTTPVKVTLPKQNSNFKAVLNTSTNTMTYYNLNGETTVYWRKSVSTTWNKLDTKSQTDIADFAKEVERFALQGITLYFRTGQTKGTSIQNTGSRPSKEVAVKISKRAAAPSVTVNYAKEAISVRPTLEYKLSTESEWTKISTTTLNLADLAEEAFATATAKGVTEGESVDIDFRTKATTTKVASRVNTITIEGQKETPDNIEIEYIGSTMFQITIDSKDVKVTNEDKTVTTEEIPAASTTNPYEYAIVLEGKTFNAAKATWTAITSNEPVKISSTTAPVGSKIYIRKKATSSAFATYPVSFEISGYTGVSTITETTLVKYTGQDKTLTFAVNVPCADTTISSLTFGGKEVTFTMTEPTKSTSGYTATVKITGTSNIDGTSSLLNKSLNGKIKFSNGDTIENGLTLTVYTGVKLTASKAFAQYQGLSYSYSNKIDDSLTTEEQNRLKEYPIEFTINAGHSTKADMAIASITLNGKTLSSTEYKMETTEDSTLVKRIRIKTEKLEAIIGAKTDTQIPFIITFTNGEIIKTGVTYTVNKVATITSETNGFGVSVTTYKTTQDKIDAAADSDSKTTITQIKDPEITLTIDKDLYNIDDTIMLSSITWNGKNILRSFTSSNNVVSITLDVSKIVAASGILPSTTSGATSASVSDTVTVNLKTDDNEEFVSINANYKITVVQ
ncbi:MAG: hypothetical protein E7256_14465 [Lachnospiraceae bacterium]|nr:hypothetical protein [Lachnospiraceae bacterium]